MTDDFPPHLVDLQRRSTAARDAAEAHRRGVDARRRADADARDAQARAAGERGSEIPSWGRRTLPPWTEAEDAEHTRLMDAVTSAAGALRAGILTAGLTPEYDVAQGLHRAAREEPGA